MGDSSCALGELALKMLIKTGTFGVELPLSEAAEVFAGLVETVFSDYNRKLTNGLRKVGNLSPQAISSTLVKEEGVMKVLKGAYDTLSDEAIKHDGWQDELKSIATPDGLRWVKRKYMAEARAKWIK